MVIPEEEKEKGAQEMFKIIIPENFQKLVVQKPQIQPNTIQDKYQKVYRIQTAENQSKEKILKEAVLGGGRGTLHVEKQDKNYSGLIRIHESRNRV